MGKVLVALFIAVIAFGTGMFMGWESGVRDANNLNQGVCSVSETR